MSSKNIILTGFMGTGKTTVGRLLAEKLGYEFVDTDKCIMYRCNQTVAEIFETKGEDAFRRMERSLAMELAQKEKLVISTGGRMMLDSANIEALQKNGRVFCLVASPDEIISRVIRDNGIDRPLLKAANPRERVMELLQERKEGYANFRQLETSRQSPEEVVMKLMDIFQSDLEMSPTFKAAAG